MNKAKKVNERISIKVEIYEEDIGLQDVRNYFNDVCLALGYRFDEEIE